MRLLELEKTDTKTLIDTFPHDEVIEVRKKALENFQKLGLPRAKNELFGKTGVRTIYDVDFLEEFKTGCYHEVPQNDNYRIVFKKGFFSPVQSNLPEGVRVRFDTNPTLKKESKNPFYYLSLALNRNFYLIETQKGLQVDKPLEIVYIDELHNSINHMNIKIVLEEDTSLELFERVLIDSPGLFNHTLDIEQKQGASLVHVKEQNAKEKTHIISNYNYTQEENSSAKVFAYENGAQLSLSLWDISLAGENAKMDFTSLQLPKNKQHLSSIINLHHDAPNTSSNQLIKQIINDEAKGVVDAKVIVSKEGVGTKADQLCNSLILSEKAQVQSFVKPQLEIFIDELEASHGATVGSLSEEQLYYLMSRGLDYDSARELLINAFRGEAFERFPKWAQSTINKS